MLISQKTVQDRDTFHGRLLNGTSVSDLKWPWWSFAGCRPFEVQSVEHLCSILPSFNCQRACVVCQQQLGFLLQWVPSVTYAIKLSLNISPWISVCHCTPWRTSWHHFESQWPVVCFFEPACRCVDFSDVLCICCFDPCMLCLLYTSDAADE